MKYAIYILTTCLIAIASLPATAQTAQSYFNTAANHYVQERRPEATAKAVEGLKKYPGDPKLKALLERMRQDEQEQQKKEKEKKEKEKKEQEKKDQEKKDQDQKNQDQKDQEKKDQEKKDQEKKEQEKKEQEQKDQEQKDKDKDGKEEKEKEQKDQQQKDSKEPDENQKKKDEVPPEVAKRLQEMKISEEKAQMLLDAMKNQEVQYLQQNKRKPTKPRDKGKPDW